MSCLFIALIKNNLKNEKEFKVNHIMLRNQIVDYIQSNPIVFGSMRAKEVVKHLGRGTLDQYCKEMRSRSTWGGAFEINIFTKIYEVNVAVKVRSNSKTILFRSPKPNSKTININWNGHHYD